VRPGQASHENRHDRPLWPGAAYDDASARFNRTKCPVKLTDLLYSGVPVVADAVGEVVAYIRHRETGLLVPTGTPEAMAEAALELLNDSSMAQRFSRQAADAMRTQHSWSTRAGQLQEVYEHLLAAASKTRNHRT